MAKKPVLETETKKELTVANKISLGFMIATGIFVLGSALFAAIFTLTYSEEDTNSQNANVNSATEVQTFNTTEGEVKGVLEEDPGKDSQPEDYTFTTGY